MCSRCGSQSHRSAECCKPFLAVSCAYCGKSGHSKASCPKAAFDDREQRRAAFEQRRAADKAAFEEREQRRAADKAAFEEREQRRAAGKAALEERQQRRAAGQAAFEERQQRRAERAEATKSWTATRDTDVCSIASTECSTASTASTVADLPPCSFCGAKRVEPKQKRFAN